MSLQPSGQQSWDQQQLWTAHLFGAGEVTPVHEPLSPAVNFHHSTGHEIVAVSNICWNSEGPKVVFKVGSHWLLSQVLPSLDVFPRFRLGIFKTPPTFLSCRLRLYRPDPVDLPLEPVQDRGVEFTQDLPNLQHLFSLFAEPDRHSSCCVKGMESSQFWTIFWSSVAQMMVQSPLMLLHMDWMYIWAPVSSLLGWRDRSFGNSDWTQSLVSLHTYAMDKAKTRSQKIRM